MANSEPIDGVIQAGGKTAGMVVDYGMLVMCGVVVLAIMGCGIWLAFRYFNRRLGDDYIEKDQVLDWLKKNRSDLLRPSSETRPSLKTHRFFNASTTHMRQAEAAQSIDAVKDITIWTLRAYRDAFGDMVDAAYANKEGFDAFFPTPEIFRAKVSDALVEIEMAIRYRLVEEFELPVAYYNAWTVARADHDQLMQDMLELAAEKDNPYERLSAALDSLYARACSFRRMVLAFAAATPDPGYTKKEPDVATMHGFKTGGSSGKYAANLFERNRNR